MSTILSGAAEFAIQELQKKSKNAKYKDDPVMWAEEVLGLFLWSGQKEILQSIVDNKKTAVKSSHSIGKTFICAVAACWWVSTRPNCMVQTTAPTYQQVHGLLWEEIRKMHAGAGLAGRVLDKDVWKRELSGIEVEVGVGKKPADSNLHGFHGTHRPDGVLVIIDEGCGVPQSLYTASDAITTARMDRVVTVGNPDDPNTEFGRIFNQPTGEWNLVTVSAYDTPNFTGEDIPEYLKASLPDPLWVEGRKREWGEDSARFKSKVLAEFPEQGSDAFFSQSAIDVAYDLDLGDDLSVPCVLGVDVAGYGDNYSVIYTNRGGRVRQHSRWSGGNAIESTENIVRAARETGAAEVRIDGSGFGSAIVDLVVKEAHENGDNYLVIKVLGGAASADLMKHANARAEQFDHLRNEMLKGNVDLDREDVELSKQLLALKYKFTARGGIQIESKKEMATRGAPSPDELDGVVYATMDTSYLFNQSEIDKLNPGDRLYADFEDMFGAPSWYFEGA